jgi:UDP-N-acetylmuramate dehydrogenase
MFDDLQSIPDLTVSFDEPLAKFTAARLGGPADILAVARTQAALISAIQWAQSQNMAWLILGGGANVLISDEGYRGIVIINHHKDVDIDAETGIVNAASGVTLVTLARRCMKAGLKSFEWAVSVPGTVGGAVVNNAGAHGGDMSEALVQATIWDMENDSQAKTWTKNDLDYAYRHSALKGYRQRYLVLDARLQLQAGHDPKTLNDRADEFVAYRKRTQPPGASLGSMFKNPPDDYAGRLIEAAGLKGYQIGGVQISPIHANFFINIGHGTASDYYALIDYAQQKVFEATGTQLVLEIECVGEGFSS